MGRLNKPGIPGYRYRSPSQTNAEDLVPNLMEDVGASQSADFERIKRGVDSTASNPANRRRQQEAGGRATLRSLGRAGMLGVAAETGEAIGREIDKRNPKVGEAVEKAIEKSGVGSLMRRGAVSPGRVELTDEAKQQMADKEMDELVTESKERDREQRAQKKMESERERLLRRGAKEGYAKGGMVSPASKRADGCAQRGKTRGKMV
jgi:hypothetical protein